MTDPAVTATDDLDRRWRRFVIWFLAVLAGGLLAIWLGVLVVDPYDTGRFPTFMPTGISDTQQHANTASRGRNPLFNAAIFGNSHGQLIDPDRLSHLTGMKFVQMTTPGSGPREQLLLMRYFLRHHRDVHGLVVTFDQTWCTHDSDLPALYNLPLWLFAASNLEYAAGMLNVRAIGASRKRIDMARSKSAPVDPAGYWNYEAGKTWNYSPPLEDIRPPADMKAPVDTHFPAITALDRFLTEVPRDYPIVAVMPPQFYLQLPRDNSPAARELAICKAELRRRIEARARGGFFDYLVDTALSRDPENFMDADHYRGPIARAIEDRIAGTLNASGKP